MTSLPMTLLAAWKATRDGFSPALCEPMLGVAFEHLERGLTAESVVLDVGCGSGHVAHAFRGLGSRAIGLDVHFPTLRAGRDVYADGEVLVGDAQHLPLRDGSVDALFAFSVFQYVDRPRALAECARVLKPGGRFAVVENLAGNPVAKLYRAWMRGTRRAYPENLAPRRHLEWSGRTVYESYFSNVRYAPFLLASPLLLFFRSVRSCDRTGRGAKWVGRALRGTLAAEQRLTGSLPAARAACWHLLVYGTR